MRMGRARPGAWDAWTERGTFASAHAAVHGRTMWLSHAKGSIARLARRKSRKGGVMAGEQTKNTDVARLIGTIEDAEHSSLEAVRRFIDAVNDAFPDLGDGEDGPRRGIIDSAFKMTEQLVSSSNRVAQNILDITERTLDTEKKSATHKKAVKATR
jgi:hypothetical protein